MKLLMGHPDFASILDWLARTFGLGNPPAIGTELLPLVRTANAFDRILRFFEESDDCWQTITRSAHSDDQDFVRFVAAVKDCVVAADIAGSAIPAAWDDQSKSREWLANGFVALPTPVEIAQLMADRLSANRETPIEPSDVDEHLRDFQRSVGQSTSRITFAKAGCGSGKTLAAYEWARQQCPGKRLFICYPTTGTATEGFRDYLVESEVDDDGKKKTKAGARLFHSRQEIDFEILDVRDATEDGNAATDADVRIASLEAWSTPIATATCDVVLGIVQNNRRGLYCWPAFAGAAFVFDEIHAYDDRLFGALLRFLAAMRGCKILLMTASLPEIRRKSLDVCLQRLGEKLTEIPGPDALETLARYHHEEVTPDCLVGCLASEIAEGESDPARGKVLWVCNTVDRAMAAYTASLEAGLPAMLYHSRFKYGDRVTRHKKVIDGFRSDAPMIAICTQVAEMSLDLSASLLISDLAPVPSLIQRLGRLNRRAMPPERRACVPPTRPFVVVEPQTDDGTPFHLPYTPEDMSLARKWLEQLPTEKISQRMLATTWESLPDVATRRPALIPSAWLDGGPVTNVLELRDNSPGVSVILQEDAEKVRAGQRIGYYTIPMPSPPVWVRECFFTSESNRLRGCLVVTNEMVDYDPEKGGQWRRRQA